MKATRGLLTRDDARFADKSACDMALSRYRTYSAKK